MNDTNSVVWNPSPSEIAASAMARFMTEMEQRGYGTFGNFEALHAWSIRDPHHFWPEVVRFCQIIADGESSPLLGNERGPTPLAKKWFPGLRLNFAENLLRGDEASTSIVSWSENKHRRAMTRGEVKRAAESVASHLGRCGVVSEDRVFGYLPNIPEAVIAMLGAATIGATWSSCGTDYQLDGLLARASRVRPKVLVSVSSYLWRGNVVDVSPTVEEIVRQVSSIEHVILVDYLGVARKVSISRVAVAEFSAIVATPPTLTTFERFSFSHPLYVMFSSGTTGKPKGIVHSVGGTLLEHKKEHILHSDIREGDRLFYQTSTSWMMWNWLVSGLATQATIVLFDGDPLLEEGNILWRMADEEKVTHFGTSAAFLGAIEKQGVKPNSRYALASLRALLSTGSTLYPSQFDYILSSIKRMWIQSISGGTDIIGCFGLGAPIKPVFRGEVQAKSLGYDVCVYDTSSKRVVGEEGELVCAQPAPSMPVCFLDDADGASYRAAYFSEYGDVWRHGDFLEETPEGGLLFLGRSDATLKPAGVRVATADIYAALQRVSVVQQALAVGYVPAGATAEKIVLFVTLADGESLTDALMTEIKETLRRSNAFYVPALIIKAPEVPRTTNNKLSELSVKRILKGEDPGNASALANPHALEFFKREGLRLVKAALG